LENVVLQKALAGFALAIIACNTSFAQCECGSCNGTTTDLVTPIGIDYNQIDVIDSCDCGSCGIAESDCSGCYGGTDRECGIKCLYASGFGGWNGLQSFAQKDIGNDFIDANSGSFDNGSLYGLAIGSQVHPYVRYELEASVRENDADSWEVQTFEDGFVTASTSTPATSGTLRSKSGMFNMLLDFQPRQVHCWNFYGGGGIGIANISGVIVAGDTYVVDDESLALQAILGVNKGITKRLDLFGEYRYFSAQSVDVNNVTAGTALGDFDYSNNSVVFGFRIRR
jgi:opacity protein-like surface antigen